MGGIKPLHIRLCQGNPAMTYRILDASEGEKHPLRGRLIGTYDSAYAALERMKRAFFEGAGKPPRWFLVDPRGAILVRPEDLWSYEH